MKTKNIILLIFVAVLIVFANSCKKNYESCIWENETTGMNLYLREKVDSSSYEMKDGTIDSYSTIKYNMLVIVLNFDLKLISEYTCSYPTDSVIGNIEYITVVSNHYLNNDTISDTINNIINVIYTNSKGMPIASPLPLNNYLQTKPICSGGINLFLSQPPSVTSIQSFKIIYKETNGKMFSAATVPIYIMP